MAGGDNDFPTPVHQSDFNSRFFSYFAPDRLVNRLARFNLAARKFGPACPGLVIATGANQKLIFPSDNANRHPHFRLGCFIRHGHGLWSVTGLRFLPLLCPVPVGLMELALTRKAVPPPLQCS